MTNDFLKKSKIKGTSFWGYIKGCSLGLRTAADRPGVRCRRVGEVLEDLRCDY